MRLLKTMSRPTSKQRETLSLLTSTAGLFQCKLYLLRLSPISVLQLIAQIGDCRTDNIKSHLLPRKLKDMPCTCQASGEHCQQLSCSLPWTEECVWWKQHGGRWQASQREARLCLGMNTYWVTEHPDLPFLSVCQAKTATAWGASPALVSRSHADLLKANRLSELGNLEVPAKELFISGTEIACSLLSSG